MFDEDMTHSIASWYSGTLVYDLKNVQYTIAKEASALESH